MFAGVNVSKVLLGVNSNHLKRFSGTLNKMLKDTKVQVRINLGHLYLFKSVLICLLNLKQ